MQPTTPTPYVIHRHLEQELVLLPEKAVFWKQKKILLLADLHLGKAAHFRKAGIAVPTAIHQEDLKVLGSLITQWQPLEVIFLGDLFHSSYNLEWEQLESWLAPFPDCRFTLIKGNHDVLPESTYRSSRLHVIDHKMEVYPFLLTHQPPQTADQQQGFYTLCGHVHPAVEVKGTARQQLSLPCFYFGLHYGLLPAFGKFTGFHKIKPKAAEQVYGILPQRVLPLHL